MDLGLKDRVAIVGGGSKGLGLACALSLAQEGANVAICSRRVENLDAAAQEIRSTTGVQVLTVPGDLSQLGDIQNLFGKTVEHFGRLDIADVQSAVDYLKSQPFVQSDRIGIVGFCYGGRVSYLAACTVSDLKAAVVYYGGRILAPLGTEGPSPLDQTAYISAPVLGLFGEDDANPTPADVATIEAELKKHNKTYEFHTYPGAGHGFNCNARDSYRPEAARDAWAKAMGWFDKYLNA